ncbi:MAG: hypothetical protein GVY04_13340 [Cyanobacteria bacterium]|jgi:hypothetical protein|nr:hypothetical protein [Cyanobacteria bacterium GSL.Bin1]
MSINKVSDDRLNSFYGQNPDFDILEFNFLNGETNNLNWENVERETTLDLLKKYQRLLRINPNPEIAKKLLNAPSPSLVPRLAKAELASDRIPRSESSIQSRSLAAQSPGDEQQGNKLGVSLDSAHAIASMTEEQFAKLLPGDEETARQMHKKAIDIKAKTQLLWANMRDAVAAPHFRALQVSAVDESDRAALALDIPSYQEMFGDLDYVDCDHCGSMFGPAAYFVDLMRIIDQYITKPNQDSISQAGGLTLNQRRPDLEEIELTCDNTNSLLPSLQIINRILEARVKTALQSSDALQSLATEPYPFTLPVNFPLEQIRSYLGHLKTDLGTIYQTFDVNELAIAREYIGLSLEEYNLITNSETDETKLKELYGIEDLASLNNVEVFLQQTGLSRTELPELLEQNLDQEELNAGVAHNFYINQVLDNRAVQITTNETNSDGTPTIENLTSETLDRIHRFIRLAKKLNWSFADLDWVLTSITATEINEEAIKDIANIKQLQDQYKLPLDVLCSFWHPMKTIGNGSNTEKPQSLFDRVYNNPFKDILGDGFYPLPDETKEIDLNSLEEQAETNPVVGRILAALRLDVNQLIDILQAIWREENTVDLTVENLSQLFRTSQILRSLGLNIEEYQILLSFLSIESIGAVSIDQFLQITELWQWMNSSNFEIDELDYILTGKLGSNLDIGYSETDVIEAMRSLWNLAVNSLLKPSDFISEEIDKSKSQAIFDKLLENNYIAEVTSEYENILQVSLDSKIAIVLDRDFTDIDFTDTDFTNDGEFAELIQEISKIVNDNDQEQLNKDRRDRQIKYCLQILQQATEKQIEELTEIASFFAIEADLAISLLDYTAIATQTPDYVKFLLTPVLQEQQEWSDIVDFFRFLSRILILTQKLKLTPTELQCVADNQETFGINELSQLSINNIQAISDFKELIAAFGDEKNEFVEYFASVSKNEENNHIEELAKITGWKPEQISLLFSPPESPESDRVNPDRDSHKTVAGITKLGQYFSLSRQLGVNVSWFNKLLKLANLPVVGESENWELYQNASQAVKEVTKAKYDDEQWVKVSEKLEGELNEHKRDVLTAWIVWRQQYDNLRHLSQELLIDVETSSEVSVSIIKEALLAIQTYLHRCRMGLEPGVEKLEIPDSWWQWIMNYRIWEANRKIFLYPENYLDPSLRQIKSPIYQELEEELLQSDITQESVETAYQNYFEKFAEIAQLKPAGGYRCTVDSNSGEQDTLYLFGRTATEPYTYYYRKCINPEANTPTWEAWQKIDLVINSEQINATYAFNKLFIFWVEIVQIEKTKQTGNNQETETETKATIKYSFQKFGNQWIQPQTLAKDIVIENYDRDSDNLWRKVTALPIPANGSEPEKILTLFGDLEQKSQFYQTQEQNPGICLTIDLLQEKTKVILEDQPSNARRSEIFDSKLMAIPTDNVLYDNYADYADDSIGRYPLIGLLGYWSMNEKSGNEIGDPVGNQQGTLIGNAKLEIVNDFPVISSRKVLQLDADGDYVEFAGENANFGKFRQSNFSIGLWLRTTESSGTLMMGLGSNSDYWQIYLENGSAKFAFRTGDGSSGSGSSDVTVDDGDWHHLAAIRDGVRSGKLYLDGVLVNEFNFGGGQTSIDGVSKVFIGKNRNTDYFHGQIAEVSVWNVVLSAEEISNASIPFTPLITENISGSHVSVTGIDNQPGWFTFDHGDEAFLAFPQQANDFPQIDDSLKVVTQDGEITLSYEASDISNLEELKFTFRRLNSTTIRQLSQKMFIGGLDNLLTLDSQLTPELNFNRFSPSDLVDFSNTRQLDFDGPNGIYFWEIFFHIPFLVANTLNSNQRFEEAQKWYHYIFNPTNPTSPSGLLAYLPMDEGSGNEISDRTGINNGTLQGNPQWKTVTDFPGVSSKNVLEFDGEGDYVQIANESNFDSLTNRATIEAWIKLDSSATGNQSIVTKGREFRLDLQGNKLHFYVDIGGTVNGTVDINDGKWHHVAAVYYGTSLQVYVDGVFDNRRPGVDKAFKNNEPILIGGNQALSGRYFNGQIAEVSIWNVALSANQILQNSSKLPITIANVNDRFWHYLPFRGNTLQKLQDVLANDAAIDAYNNNPFDPHAIARLRIGAYEKAIVMKYIDNLLDWGDLLFAQDNRESISEATILYILAYDLLGEEPENLGKRQVAEPKTFQEIKGQYESNEDGIPQFLIDLEHSVSDPTRTTITSTPFNDLNTYFCAPENEQFIAYWERVEDRLYKIRHSLSIEGIRRQLALFQPAIDPIELVRAVAAGTTPLSVVSQLTPAVPHYRFDYMLERATNITSTLIQLGESLLSALEKKDAEELALLIGTHEQSILKLITTTKEKQIDEAKETLKSLNQSKANADKRKTHYQKLYDENLNGLETIDLLLRTLALVPQNTVISMYGLGVPGHLIPTIFGFSNGGMEPGDASEATAQAAQATAEAINQRAELIRTGAEYQRRREEWELEKNLAEIEVQQIEAEIEAQKIQQAIAEQELKIHQKNIEQAKEIEDFLKGKFTNQELYQWMVNRLSILYFQTYKIALDMAVAAQSAYQYEINSNDTFINFAYWDSLKQGLLAGESLMLSLNQLEKAYIEGNSRSLEIEKTISLRQLNLLAFQQLKETGECEFELNEQLFDLDFPGHYARQIKTIAVSIPAVVSPYQNISATLTQTSNKTLLKPNADAVKFLLGETEEIPDASTLRNNWRSNQKIAISKADLDNGLFALNFFADTRYFPFEGTGAVSTWKLSLPKPTNRIDFDTISDVIINLSYTALDGGDAFRKTVTNSASLKSSSEAYYFNLKQAFPNEWHTFMNPETEANSQELNFQVSEEIIPPQIEDTKLTGIIFKLDAPDASSPLKFATIKIEENKIVDENSINETVAKNWFGDWAIDFDLTKVPNHLKKDGFLDPEIVNNIELILIYEGQIDWDTLFEA